IAQAFWNELADSDATLVSFNGRAFDVPVLELAAFRYGIAAPKHFQRGGGNTRYRYGDAHIDVRAVLTNHAAYWFDGGLEVCTRLRCSDARACSQQACARGFPPHPALRPRRGGRGESSAKPLDRQGRRALTCQSCAD